MVTPTKMYLLLIPIALLKFASSITPFECGRNGRFEYCIDEIPGCVVGCHCHPGYYFDTDTKICEPNTKLIEHHRRHNLAGPTRAQKAYVTEAILRSEIDSTMNPIDTEIKEISKDADSLGDWLYNQFFKTIENQVINSTNEEQMPSRRKATRDSSAKPPKRRKKTGKRKSSKKNRKESLKRKLMRISEDHSIFNDKSSSSSESGSSEDSSSDTSTKEDSKEHAHKKIVVFQKKPKVPLPSFIFLPNMDTPYYPPLGLPPPPVIPMYPIIPVPPMVPVYPGTTCETAGTNRVETTSPSSSTILETTVSQDSTEPSATVATQATTEVVTTEDSTAAPATDRPLRGHMKRSHHKRHPKHNLQNQDISLQALEHRLHNLPPQLRQKMIQKLRNKLKSAPELLFPPWKDANNLVPDSNYNQVEEGTPILDDNAIANDIMQKNIQSNPVQENDRIDKNVGFKYISQLIHKINLSNSNDIPPLEYKPSNLKANKFPTIPLSPSNDMQLGSSWPEPLDWTRRVVKPSNSQEDDLYFTKLGRQIAEIIRGLDIEKEKIEVQENKSGPVYAHSPYFNYNSPKSFWERSVRSPFKHIHSNSNKFDFIKKSNELLFDIENKVEVLASTSRPLDLLEMENIINMMETAKKNIQNHHKPVQTMNKTIIGKNLNVNLWPKELHRSQNNRNVFKSLSISNKTISEKNNKELSGQNILNIDGIHIENIHKVFIWRNNTKQENGHKNHILNIHNQQLIYNKGHSIATPNRNHSMETNPKTIFQSNPKTFQRLNYNIPPPDVNRNVFYPFNKHTNVQLSNRNFNANVYHPSSYFQYWPT